MTTDHFSGAGTISDDQFRLFFEAIDEGFCLIELIYDDAGNSVDWLYRAANPAFERQSGLAPVGKTGRELFPTPKRSGWKHTLGLLKRGSLSASKMK